MIAKRLSINALHLPVLQRRMRGRVNQHQVNAGQPTITVTVIAFLFLNVFVIGFPNHVTHLWQRWELAKLFNQWHGFSYFIWRY